MLSHSIRLYYCIDQIYQCGQMSQIHIFTTVNATGWRHSPGFRRRLIYLAAAQFYVIMMSCELFFTTTFTLILIYIKFIQPKINFRLMRIRMNLIWKYKPAKQTSTGASTVNHLSLVQIHTAFVVQPPAPPPLFLWTFCGPFVDFQYFRFLKVLVDVLAVHISSAQTSVDARACPSLYKVCCNLSLLN